MTAHENVSERHPVLRQGKLAAIVLQKAGGRKCCSHEVFPGDTLEVVDVIDWPKVGQTTQKIRVVRDGRIVGDAVYNGARLRDLTR